MSQKPTIIFVCEHGAAKSIVAAAYSNRIANESGIHLRARARGLEPELALSAAAVTGLLKDGLSPTELTPQKLLLAELETARRVVTFCDLPDEYQGKAVFEYWENVAPVSEGYQRARDVIVSKIEGMMKEFL
jgi:protein-tyrosine-phosphatase